MGQRPLSVDAGHSNLPAPRDQPASMERTVPSAQSLPGEVVSPSGCLGTGTPSLCEVSTLNSPCSSAAPRMTLSRTGLRGVPRPPTPHHACLAPVCPGSRAHACRSSARSSTQPSSSSSSSSSKGKHSYSMGKRVPAVTVTPGPTWRICRTSHCSKHALHKGRA